MPAGLDHSKRNDKSCQKSCLPWQDAGSVVLAIAHPHPLLHWGHRTCLFKVCVWLSPSCPGTCFNFPFRDWKAHFSRGKLGAKEGAVGRWSNALFLSAVNVFERLVSNLEHMVGTRPLMSWGLACCWRSSPISTPPSCMPGFPSQGRQGVGKEEIFVGKSHRDVSLEPSWA